MEENNFDFLKPDNLKSSLIFCSLYIAFFESFKDYIIEEVKGFYTIEYNKNGNFIDPEYKENVLNRNKSELYACLYWLEEINAVSCDDLAIFDGLKKYRNKLSHEMLDFVFSGDKDELERKLVSLFELRIKIEKWWILNIDISIDPDFSDKVVEEKDVISSSQILYKIIIDILTGNEDESNYYYNEFMKNKDL